MKATALLGLTLFVTSHNATAHEYWLDPIDTSIVAGQSVIVDVRNGQNFNGSAFPFDAQKFEFITVSSPDETVPYSGRLGDYPALHPELNVVGLHSINLATNATLLKYKSWEQFNEFLEYHALESVATRHLERKLKKIGVRENFFRFAKTIIQVNDSGNLNLNNDNSNPIDVDSHNAFAPSGALFEMLLLDNPYSQSDSIRIKLLFDSAALSGRQVELFWKGDTPVRKTAKTNQDGIATFKLMGEGDYLLNAVQMVEATESDIHWLSYWASITFER